MGGVGDNTINKNLLAIVETTCLTGGENWMAGKNFLFMGNTVDAQEITTGNPYVFRCQQFQHLAWTHNVWLRPGKGPINFRNSDSETSVSNQDETSEWNLFADNVMNYEPENSFMMIRLCPDSGCNCTETSNNNGGSSGCGQAGSGETVRVQNWIFERNLHRFSGSGNANGKFGIYELWGADHTVRNEIAKLDNGWPASNGVNLVIAGGNSVGRGPGGSGDLEVSGNIEVYNNSIYVTTQGFGQRSDLCANRGLGSGCDRGTCLCYNNHMTVTRSSGASLGTGGSFSYAGNVLSTTDVYDGSMPAQGSGGANNFVPAVGSAPIDSARTFNASTDLGFWTHDDALGQCRPGPSRRWDAGAVEVGGYACSTSGPQPPLTLLAPTLLQP